MKIIRETHKRVDYNDAIMLLDDLLQEIRRTDGASRVTTIRIDVNGNGFDASHTITVDRIERAKRQ